jgi:hypothetical protein
VVFSKDRADKIIHRVSTTVKGEEYESIIISKELESSPQAEEYPLRALSVCAESF